MLRGVAQRTPFSTASRTLTPSASPWTYTNTGTYIQLVTISGGTVTSVTFAQGGLTGLLGGQFLLRPGDAFTMVYVIAPSNVSVVDVL